MYKNQDKKPYKLKLVSIDVYNYEEENAKSNNVL
jgi:hypothetical protein